MTTTFPHTILAEDGPETVQAQPATPGLYVYEIPATVDEGAPCRWRLGHHSGRQIAKAPTAEAAHRAAAAIADWTTWTDEPDAITARLIGPGAAPTDRRDLQDRAEAAGAHFGNCGWCLIDEGPLRGGHSEMCAYVAGISSRCTCG
jgi:hypothetical protein